MPGRSRSRAYSKRVAWTLTEEGIPAVEAGAILELLARSEIPIAEIVQGRLLVAWDLDYADPARLPLEDHRGVLVVRFPDRTVPEDLALGIVRLWRTAQHPPVSVNAVVLEPILQDFRPKAPPPWPRIAA
jgi:hypothetical protein